MMAQDLSSICLDKAFHWKSLPMFVLIIQDIETPFSYLMFVLMIHDIGTPFSYFVPLIRM